jgi:hypothetical protein
MRPTEQVSVETKLDELDRLLNDPDTRMDPARVWSLLAELSAQHARTQTPAHG